MKTLVKLMAVLLVVVLLVNLTGCYGSFTLTKKLYNWNGSLGDKFLNTAVMWVMLLLPVYEAAGFIDFVILNTVEFWTESNPLAMNANERKVEFASNDGKTYKFTITKNNVRIEEISGPDQGKTLNLSYSPETSAWTMSDDKTSTTIAKVDGKNMKLFYPDGNVKSVQLAQ